MSQRGKTSGEPGRVGGKRERRKKKKANREGGWEEVKVGGVMMPGYHGARMGDRKGRSKWGGERRNQQKKKAGKGKGSEGEGGGEQAPAEQQEGERRKSKRKSM